MNPGRRPIKTAPDIEIALKDLREVTPVRPGSLPARPGSLPAKQGTSPATPESFPASGAVAVGSSSDDVVKLPFSLGDVIAGKYEIIGLIGAGGVGFVVSAMHLELGEMVALKFLREESLVHDEVVARFAREARAAAKIKSEYVARVYDVGSLPNGIPFIVMEYLHGKDLADIVRGQGRLPIKTAVEYLMQACEALASAHAMGTVHRDIKPENLFLTRQAEGVELIKVLDFGISKVALASGHNTGERQFVRTMMPMGTPAYMSPEQIRAVGEVDARTDIWALGCVLFELLTGSCVFDAPTLMQLGAAILERAPLPLRKLLPEAPAELEAIILKCLEKDASKRFQNVAELAVALYPFAPRRARISAERSSYILSSTNPSVEPLELTSISPPPLESGTHPTPRGQSPTPEPMTTGLVDEVRAMRPNRKPLYFFGAGAALAVVAALFFVNKPSADAPPAAGEPAKAAAAPVAAPAPSPLAAAPSQVAAPAQPAAAADATASASGAPRPGAAAARNGNKAPRAVRPVAVPKPTKPVAPGRPPRADDEPDVGY